MKNEEVAKLLYAIADLLELQDIPWKPAAYRKAAQQMEMMREDVETLWKEGTLEDIPGVGKHIAEKIREFLETGKLLYYESLKKKIPIDVEGLKQVPSLGPKRIKLLYQKAHIKTIAELDKALRAGTLENLPGLGKETLRNLQEGVEMVKKRPKRFLYMQAERIAHEITAEMKKLPFIQNVEIAGSFRRGRETVGDLDVLVVSTQPEKVMDAFTHLKGVTKVLASGSTKSSVLLTNTMQVDLRVVKRKEFGSAMNYFIGSKEHNIELRKYALSKGYTLSEYGLFTKQGKKWVAGRTEEEIYQRLGLQYIPPEMRENKGEIETARRKALPTLVQEKDLKGVFHNHSTWSDGSDSLLGMAQKAEELGYKFISFNDHFGSVGITNPLSRKSLPSYLKEMEKVRKKVGIRVFSGVEIDIQKDGTLGLPSKTLQELDVVIASVHQALRMTEEEMTRRVCNALEYPVNILGHPTERRLNSKEPIKVNFERIFETAQRRKVFLEINSQPTRMDLAGELVRQAREKGCSFALSTDAHAQKEMTYARFGLLNARRGWLEKKNLLNCWSLPKIEKALAK